MDKADYGRQFSQSLSTVTGEADEYACPLCLERFPLSDIDALTWDHYPPQSIGGRDVALVCESCREKWSPVDAGISRLRDRDGFDQEHPGMLPTIVSIPTERPVRGLRHRAALRMDKDSVEIFGRDEANPQEAINRLNEFLKRKATQEEKVRIELARDPRYRFRYRLVERSFLKAAYLAAFGTLGYPYILSAPLAPIREQMLQPGADLFAGHMVVFSPQPEGTNRSTSLAYLHAPAAATGLAVFFEGYQLRQWCIVVLPIPARPDYPKYGELRQAMYQAEYLEYVSIDRSLDLTRHTELVLQDEDGKQWPVY